MILKVMRKGTHSLSKHERLILAVQKRAKSTFLHSPRRSRRS